MDRQNNRIFNLPAMILILSVAIVFTAHPVLTNEIRPDNQSQNTQAIPDTAYFAGGCFWCTEAIFERVKGVTEVVSGYSGGSKRKPTYKEVAGGQTDHAESIRVVFEPSVVSYKELVEMFFTAHDPTQLNRQGPDIGPQYRSAIFYTDKEQKKTAENVIYVLEQAERFEKSIVTEVTRFKFFHKAEDYHQDYYEHHPNQPYIVNVSKPKVEKFEKMFKHKLKEEYK